MLELAAPVESLSVALAQDVLARMGFVVNYCLSLHVHLDQEYNYVDLEDVVVVEYDVDIVGEGKGASLKTLLVRSSSLF